MCFDLQSVVVRVTKHIPSRRNGGMERYYHNTKYEGTSKIFRTCVAIYTAVVVARSTGIW
jgi:hypothetical protein